MKNSLEKNNLRKYKGRKSNRKIIKNEKTWKKFFQLKIFWPEKLVAEVENASTTNKQETKILLNKIKSKVVEHFNVRCGFKRWLQTRIVHHIHFQVFFVHTWYFQETLTVVFLLILGVQIEQLDRLETT